MTLNLLLTPWSTYVHKGMFGLLLNSKATKAFFIRKINQKKRFDVKYIRNGSPSELYGCDSADGLESRTKH